MKPIFPIILTLITALVTILVIAWVLARFGLVGYTPSLQDACAYQLQHGEELLNTSCSLINCSGGVPRAIEIRCLT